MKLITHLNLRYIWAAFLFFIGGITIHAQNFTVPIQVSNGTLTQTINVGVSPSATNNFDTGIDVIAPPAPPSGFYASMGASGNEFYTDIRSNLIEEKVYKINFRFNEDASGFPTGNITFSWNSALFQTNTSSATFVVGTSTTDLRTVNTLTLSAASFGSFTFGQLKFTPQTTALPSIGLNPSSLSYTTALNANPAAQSFSISNTGGGTLNWTATDDAPWLTLSATTGTGTGTVTASVNANGLAAGSYNGTITISATGATSKTLTVSLAVTAPTNQPPVVANAIADQTLTAGGAAFTRDLTATPAVFSDPDNDALTFTVNVSNPNIATATLSGTTLTINPVAAGTATITVTANDGKGGTVNTSLGIVVGTAMPDVIFVHNGLQNISNAVIYNGKITFLAALDPTLNSVVGYPDAVEWVKLHLVNENGVLKEVEPTSIASSTDHGDVKVTPDGNNLALVYQAPTGDSYGFRMPYKLWNGTSLTESLIFSNANLGAWPRIEFLSNGYPIIHSFAHAGYFVAAHRLQSSQWDSYQLTDYNNHVSNLHVVRESDEKIHLFGTRNIPTKGLVHFIVDATKSPIAAVPFEIVSGNDIEFNGATRSSNGDIFMLYSEGSQIKIAHKTGDSWTIKLITSLSGVGRRGSITFTQNGQLLIALQNTELVKVLYLSGNEWKVGFERVLRHTTAYDGSQRAPSLVEKAGNIYVVYKGKSEVYASKVELASIQPTLSVTPATQTVVAGGGSSTFSVSITNSTGTPTCASNATWLTVTTCSVTQVTATIAANTSSTARTGMISITVTGATGSPATVTVEQAAATATPTLSVTPAKQTVVAGGGTSTFAVSITNSTGTPTCASNATWLTVTTCSVTQVITQAAANTGSLRSGTVTVTLAGATGSPATVTVEQAAGLAPPSFTVTPAKQTIGASGGSLTFSINMPNGSGAPTCSWLGDWLSASCSTSQLLVYTTANTGPARIGTVTLSLAGETPVTVTIEQGAVGTNPGLVVTPAKQTVVAGGGTSTFAVSITNSTGTPTCASNATWLTVTTCSATQVITQAAANTGSLRSGMVTVTLAGATGSPATVTVEQANASTSGVVTVRLSSTLNGYVGQSTDTGILVGDTSGKNIVAYAGKLVFDPSILKVSLMPTDGTLSAGWSVTPNMNNSGELIFAAANATPLAGTGNLLKLKVEFLKAGITELKWASFTFNEGDPSATMSGATVTVSSFVCGDATMNGSVSGLDASRILQHAAGILALEGEGLKACDVTGNGSCSASDASLILQYVAQLNPVFNCRFNALGKTGESSSVQTNRAATIRLDVPTTAVQGQTGVIGIKTSALTSLDNVLAYTFSLGFNSNVCRIIELDPANTLSGGNWSITPNTNVANSIIVAAANATPMLGEGTLLKLKVKYLGTGTCNLVWSKFEMNEGTPSVVSVNNSFTVSPATGVEAENIPAGFGIQGVYPNPFNQTTTLLFSLAHAGQVKTEVYSLTGQKIWDTPMHAVLAGEGKIVLNAVGWSAGVYVARITVQTAGQTMVYNQKITVIK